MKFDLDDIEIGARAEFNNLIDALHRIDCGMAALRCWWRLFGHKPIGLWP